MVIYAICVDIWLTTHPTPHLNGKKLSTNSSWDFEHIFETMDDYWVGPDENFFPESTPTRWRCDHFSKKWTKSKSDTTFTHKKTSVTPTFCKRNFSRMNRFGLMNFLSSTDPSSVNFQILHFWPKAIFNQKSQLSDENWVGKIPNIVSFGDKTHIIP